MTQTSLFALFLAMALAMAGAFTAGQMQLTLFVSAGCTVAAHMLAAFVGSQANRARERALRER